LLFAFNFSAAQCRNFTETSLIPQLEDYLLTGRYHSFVMKEGDEIMIFKSLSSGIKYKFIVGVDQNLPQNFILIIKDWQNNILFDNRTKNFTNVFELKVDSPQRVKIYIKIPLVDDPPKQGCVGLVIGMKKIAP
jgi:hypothetical protein